MSDINNNTDFKDGETDPLVVQDQADVKSKSEKGLDVESSGGSYFSMRHLSNE